MNLVQKLPIGLGLACLMMLSSCSKEDVQPTAQVGGVNESSGLRVDDGINVLPYFPSTTGSTGLNILPSEWQRNNNFPFSNDLQAHPTGTSSLAYLWGNQSYPWIVPLAPIPGAQNTTSAITVSTATNAPEPYSKRSCVTTKIKYLKPGKKYSVTFYVASAIPQPQGPEIIPVTYAKAVIVQITNSWLNSGPVSIYYDISASKNAWVAKTITFKATATSSAFKFFAETADEGQYSYANIFVDKNSIKEVN